jgi:hypothetical protein
MVALAGRAAGPASRRPSSRSPEWPRRRPAGVIGLSAGAPATRRGSVATMLLIELGDPRGDCGVGSRYVRDWLADAATAVIAATGILWLTS